MAVRTPETTRQRGQRHEHAPRDDEGERHEPEAEVAEGAASGAETGEGPQNFADGVEDGANYGDTRAEFVKPEDDDDDDLPQKPESTVIQGSTEQRHGAVEQRKGVSIRDDAGNVIGTSELWRCQCGAKFLGKSAKDTEELYMVHIRKFDAAVPPPKPTRTKKH